MTVALWCTFYSAKILNALKSLAGSATVYNINELSRPNEIRDWSKIAVSVQADR